MWCGHGGLGGSDGGILGIQIVVLIATMEDSMVEVSGSVGDKVTEYGDFLD